MTTNRIIAFVVLLLLAALPAALAQSVTGQISGAVVDPGGAVIAGATVQLSNDLTRQVRSFTTESRGSFLFTDLVPGDYSVHIEFPGFKSYDQKAVNVSSQEKVALHDIRLEVGDVSSTVTVQSDSAHVATDSSDRSVLVNTTQIENTPIPGRDFMGLMESLPGVVDLNPHDARGYNAGMPTINGGQSEKLNISLDGIKSQDSGNTGYSGNISPSMDAIAEVRVMISSYSAEYGGRAGGQMSVTVKNGTNQFHGSTYFFFRNEFLNANNYFNNQTGLAKPFYRYNNPGGTFGGPLLIPGTGFNKSRTKLFFFFSEDYLRFLTPSNLSKQTMPTSLERSGDFSQTSTTTGRLIPVKDPTSGQQFPGNIMPASRISPAGLAILNLFPVPSAKDATGQRQYNSLYQFSRQNQREDRILRLDYNVAPQDASLRAPDQRLPVRERLWRSSYGHFHMGADGGGTGQSNPPERWPRLSIRSARTSSMSSPSVLIAPMRQARPAPRPGWQRTSFPRSREPMAGRSPCPRSTTITRTTFFPISGSPR